MKAINQQPTILLVDDDPSILRLLQHTLEKSFGDNVQIEAIGDPSAALTRIEESSIDVLLSDLEMPGVGGLEVLRQAKQRNAHCQVIMLTGHSSQQALLEAMELGASDYLLKPFESEQISELVGQALDRRIRWKRALAGTWQQEKQAAAAES